MTESQWDFPAGAVSADQSLKGYRAQAKDGDAGEVSWCDYAPGESYLVVTRHPHLGGKHHVVPAGAVAAVDHEKRLVKLDLTEDEFDKLPVHEEPSKQIDWDYINRFEIGWLRGRGVPLPDPPQPE
jgi:hypothetical protein